MLDRRDRRRPALHRPMVVALQLPNYMTVKTSIAAMSSRDPECRWRGHPELIPSRRAPVVAREECLDTQCIKFVNVTSTRFAHIRVMVVTSLRAEARCFSGDWRATWGTQVFAVLRAGSSVIGSRMCAKSAFADIDVAVVLLRRLAGTRETPLRFYIYMAALGRSRLRAALPLDFDSPLPCILVLTYFVPGTFRFPINLKHHHPFVRSFQDSY
ncbi:hypothetical protein C2E23DRAFT_286196 [Lenzites betulinus]|nr:hypothetical protein C2E23DRAFT_286196 [Lenzites betulinus]